MMRAILTLICALVVGVPAASCAQTPATPPAAAPAGAAVVAAPSISPAQARAALEMLNDPAKRAAFAATLTAIVNAQAPTTPHTAAAASAAGTTPAPAADKSPAAETPAVGTPAAGTTVGGLTIPLAPDSLGAQVLLSASGFVEHLGKQAVQAMDTAQSLPLLYGWVVVMATNPIARDILMDVSWRVILALACAVAVEYGLRRAMRGPIRGLENLAPVNHPAVPPATPAVPSENNDIGTAGDEAGESESPQRPHPSAWNLLERVPLVIARLVLELVPVFGIALIGHLIAGSTLGGHAVSRLIILAVVDAYVICAALLCVARMLLSPQESGLRLFHLRDTAADYLMRWSRRLIVIAVWGYAIGEVGLLLGLSDIAHDGFEKAVGLVIHVCLAIIVIQKRGAVRRWLRAPPGGTGTIAAMRNRLAQVWHGIALFVLVAFWLIWVVEVPHGFAAVLHYFAVTALVLIGARLALLLLLGLVDRVMQPAPPVEGAYPSMQSRLVEYRPAVSIALRLLIYILCVLGLLQLYGLNTFLWLVESALGIRILSATGTLVLTIILAFGAWEGVNGGVQQHLDRLQREAQLARSARLRTLLPLLRSTLLITIAIFAGLTILSEIGINIGPLLAGAGIVGVAIGFGSQKLVQDLITGIFLLLENAMQVGDFVTVSGLSGVVENLSVRTIRLRAGDGSVHIIPFSSVTSVTNVNRGLGNAAVSVSVDYNEDTDRVAAELTAVVADMRNDPALSAMMLSDFQLWGVDKVDGAEVTIIGQVVCTDAGRWPVQREFNRRMKRRFQELGIKIYNPVQTITVSVPASSTDAQAPARKPAEKGDDRAHAQAAD